MIETQSNPALMQDDWERLAHQLAHEYVITERPKITPPFLEHLKQQQALLQDAYQHLAKISDAQLVASPADWILDNSFLLQQTCRQIREDMPPGFYHRLPKLDKGDLAGYARAYGIAHKLIEVSQARLDLDSVKLFVHMYQDLASLTTGELWALPVMLRLELVELLTQAISRIFHLPQGNPFPDINLPDSLKDNEIVANCITSLWTLSIQNWQEFFESVSRVEQILGHDPASLYSHMDFETRNHYRNVIEELAKGSLMDEANIAMQAVQLAQAATSAREKHVGYYLI